MKPLKIQTAKVFEPLLHPGRYKGAWGGRGSGKSHYFAEAMVEAHYMERGEESVCIREVQKSIAKSSKALIEYKIKQLGLGESDGFKVFNEVIETPGDGAIIFQGMQDHTAESIKSLFGMKRAWIEEAQTLSSVSLQLLKPTIREENSELWFSWNARRKTDPVDAMFRGPEIPADAIVVKANYSDNPWFPDVLEQERQDDLRINPDQYPHIWEGEYLSVMVGAYYARQLMMAKAQGRLTRVPIDPLMSLWAFWDIGGTGAKADAVAIWICQFIGMDIRIVDYHEAVGQDLSFHLNWLRINGYDSALCVLPHDGEHHSRTERVTYEGAVKSGGFKTRIVPNQGTGAAMMRIEAARRLFPAMYFDKERCAAGIEAIGWYHEKKDEARNIGLGPCHDWSSHGCFTAETLIQTRYGTRSIIDLSENTDEVLTSCGYKKFKGPFLTKKNAVIVEVKFTDGMTVRCTPDHLFLTEKGWKSAEKLTKGLPIQYFLMPTRNILTEAYIGFGQATDTFLKAVQDYIGMFGGMRLAKSLMERTYITKMAISKTIHLSTLSALTQKSTYLFQEMFTKGLGKGLLKKQEKKPLIGIDQKKEYFGISDMLMSLRGGQNGKERKRNALNVNQYLVRWLEKAVIHKFIAQLNARFLRTGKGKIKHPVTIESVKKLSEKADVYDITTPGVGNFCLQNLAIVHNSDAFGMMAVAYEQIQKERARNQKRQPVVQKFQPYDASVGY